MNSWMDCWPAWIHWLLASLWIASASSWLTGIYESLWATSQNYFYLDYLPDVSLGFCHRDAGSILSLFRERAEIAASLSWKQDLMVGNQTISMPLSRWLQWLLCHQVGDCRWTPMCQLVLVLPHSRHNFYTLNIHTPTGQLQMNLWNFDLTWAFRMYTKIDTVWAQL